ncbi:MAG: hypothetical protein A2284_07200 [Deltaproteobacteria bacterium RIFOXYA12_FULL_61_11]|nr:MAG: hypothetical protein A2284_07200 [Deltaproteobacteria bacterium RIFOXYA12_FULL_61_11]
MTGMLFPCPYLEKPVELTEERADHIAERHPDLLPLHLEKVGETLQSPDQVRRSVRFSNARLFSRWIANSGKYIVVVVMSEPHHHDRHWIITAYQSRRLSEGVVEWSRA